MSRRYDLRIAERRAFDLLASSIANYIELDEWFYANEGIRIQLPFAIDSTPDKIHIFRTSIEVPSTNHRWFLKFVVNGNARLRINGENYFGVDEVHTYVPITSGKHDIELIVSPRTLFGLHKWGVIFSKSYVVEVAWNVMKVALKILEILRLVEELPQDSEFRKDLQNLLLNTLRNTRINPSLKQVSIALSLLYESELQKPFMNRMDLRRPYGDYGWLAHVYGIGVLKGYLEDVPATPMNKVIEEARRIDEELSKGFEMLKNKYPKIGTIYAVGHSHIDAAWLWPRSETIEKVLRTFSTITNLLNDYRFAYVQSSAQYYQWVEELDKQLFEKIKKFVSEGKWIIVGGMWIESDTNLVEGESLARQFLYGQRYFLEKFGRIARIGWIPDSFGFSGNLPQIMRKSGVEVFVTHKVMWNDTNKFPYHTFIWRGVDGTEIPVQVLITSYNESATPASIYRYWSLYKHKDSIPFTIYSYGYGDGGGGPTREMLEYIDLANSLPMLPKVEHLVEDSYINELLKNKNAMPTWNGELYVEIHRGTYTTNIDMKNAMAEAEKAIIEMETLSTIAQIIGKYTIDKAYLDNLWKLVLFNQFHDIIPGSSIKEVYDDALNDLKHVIEESSKIISKVIDSISDKHSNKYHIAIANTLPWKVKTVVEIPKGFGIPKNVECQEDSESFKIMAETIPMGITYIELGGDSCKTSEGVRVYEYADGVVMENSYMVVKINGNGDIESIKLKENNVEILREPAKIVAHVDKPGVFDAWDVTDEFFEVRGIELKALDKPKVISKGSLEACVEVVKGFEDSKIIQRICMQKDVSYITIFCRIDWRSKGVLVKHWFKTTTKASKAIYDIPFGVIERSTKMESSWDEAKFEVPAVRWADISDDEKGLAIIAPSRHGYSAKEGDIGLSLIRSPLFPNPWSDLGIHEIIYYIYPHKGNYQVAEVPRIAQEALHKPIAKIVRGIGKEVSVLFVEPPKAIISAFKPSYDGNAYILRIYNPYREPVEITLHFNIHVNKVEETDIIELNRLVELNLTANNVKISLKPFEIKTLKIYI
ncbi:glycoside hydrolase family 38 C-terminal domain-containing protein [Ignisphaera sp. 4213-co]|uniref:Glycoside hydrolase family 38 C-terminal domain-containing protein n=1 Tax=Ignisphaera cupida TaxID=3050454 RepID=A0ABD4Z859_9CREN|nr:glycoside hydrolase family 38 C-terminal domain-containing protein [Ignisphaera sp. 4213-co]MDK6028480.1 glycoside hydrolase family 38 C-terminal domain-containing protein [Ignisphaera sp. 4213-co]